MEVGHFLVAVLAGIGDQAVAGLIHALQAGHFTHRAPEIGQFRVAGLGGEIVVSGTPEDVAKCKASETGKFLKALL